MSAHRTIARLVRDAFPLREAVGDYLHRRYCRMAQADVAADLTAHAFALVEQHAAHAFQLANDPVDFLHRRAGDTPDQRIQVVGDRIACRVSLAALRAHERDVAPDEITDLTLDRVRRRLVDIAQFFRRTSARRSVFLRAGFLWTKLVRSKPLGSDGRHGLPPIQTPALR